MLKPIAALAIAVLSISAAHANLVKPKFAGIASFMKGKDGSDLLPSPIPNFRPCI